MLLSDVSWSWDDLDEASFTRLLRNFTEWHARNSAPDSPGRFLFSQLKTMHKAAGYFRMSTQVDAAAPDADRLLDDYLAAISEGTGVTYHVGDRYRAPWLYAVTEWSGFVEASVPRWKSKSAYVREVMPEEQLRAVYRQLTRDDYPGPYGMIAIVGFGGKINEVAPGDTATAQRDSIAKMLYCSLWSDPADDALHQRWIREAYEDVYASTGGVPRPGGVNDGCYINYADADLADPALNRSGIPWHELYFKGNYPGCSGSRRRGTRGTSSATVSASASRSRSHSHSRGKKPPPASGRRGLSRAVGHPAAGKCPSSTKKATYFSNSSRVSTGIPIPVPSSAATVSAVSIGG